MIKVKKHLSKKHKRNLSLALKGRISPTTGMHFSDTTKKKMSLSHLGQICWWKGKHFSKKHRLKIGLSHIGFRHSKTTKRKHSLSQYALWQNNEYRENQIRATLRASHRRPNYKEQHLNSILQKNFQNEWKYVGSGDFILGGKNPDFMNVNGKKLLIELYGDYWHRGQTGTDRISHFKQFGFNTLVVWEKELENENKIIDKIESFMRC